MNIGKKITELRVNKNMSVEDLSTALNVSTEEILKYENNEMEPSLDKKILLCQIFDTTLDEISVKIERKPKPIDRYEEETLDQNVIEEVEDIKEEVLVAQTSVTYNEKIFDSMFKNEFKKYTTQTIISAGSYLIFAFFSLMLQATFFYILFFVMFITNVIKLMLNKSKFKNNKIAWINQFNGVKKEYYFYEDFIDIISSDAGSNTQRFEYSNLINVLEKDSVILCVFNTMPRSILTISKENIKLEDLVKIRDLLHKKCKDYVEVDPITEEDKKNAKIQTKVRTLLNISIILCFVGYFCINLIYNLNVFDRTLAANLLLYSVSLLFPIFCILMGVIAKKKYLIKATKNIVIGVIVLVFCVGNMATVYMNHIISKSKNNDELITLIEKNESINIPDYYYTIYKEEPKDSNIISYQIMTFAKQDEIKAFEESIKNNANWKTKDQIPSSEIIELTSEAKEYLYLMLYDTPDSANYYLQIENGNKEIFLAYYNTKDTGYMLAVEYLVNNNL